jgi:PAS domain S-box-containing protein
LKADQFVALSEAAAVKKGFGLVGRVWSSGEAEWVEDIRVDAGSLRGPAACDAGLTTACAVPIKAGHLTQGVLAAFSRTRSPADPEVETILDRCAEALSAFAMQHLPEYGTTQAEGYFRFFTENMLDILLIADVRGVILYESPAVTSILGYPLDERIGRNVFDFIHPDDRPAAIEAVRAGVQDPGSTQRVEVRTLHKNGSWRDLETVGKADMGGLGGPVIIATSRDVTETKETRRMLEESRTRLQLLNAISTGIRQGMSVDDVISLAIGAIAAHFPSLRIAFSTIDEKGSLNVIESAEPPEMPSLTGLAADLTSAPDYLAALRAGQVVAIEDVHSEPIVAPLVEPLGDGGTRALLDVPVNHSQRLVGLLCFDAPSSRKWSDHETQTLREIADYLAIALREAAATESRRRTPGVVKGQSAGLPAQAAFLDPPRLSAQDTRVLKLMAAGLTNRDIAREMEISANTVKDHVSSIFSKLKARNRAQAVLLAGRHGLLEASNA